MPAPIRKTIRTTNDLPNWFNIEHYGFTKNLDSAGWYLALSQREIHYNLLRTKNASKEFFKSSYQHYRKHKKHYKNLENLRESPDYTPSEKEPFYLNKSYQLKEIINDPLKFAQNNAGVTSLTLQTLHYYGQLLFEDNDNIHKNIDLIKVDFSFTDNDLIKQFATYLKTARNNNKTFKYYDQIETQKRQRQNKNKIITDDFRFLPQNVRFYTNIKAGIKIWIKHNILAYLDLHLWELENHVAITNKTFTNALHQNNDPSEDNKLHEEDTRKTTHKNAMSAIENYNLRLLKADFINELLEKHN